MIQKDGGKASRPAARPQVAPDLDARLAKFQRVPMPFHSEGLSPREHALVKKLVEASQYFERFTGAKAIPMAWPCCARSKEAKLLAILPFGVF